MPNAITRSAEFLGLTIHALAKRLDESHGIPRQTVYAAARAEPIQSPSARRIAELAVDLALEDVERACDDKHPEVARIARAAAEALLVEDRHDRAYELAVGSVAVMMTPVATSPERAEFRRPGDRSALNRVTIMVDSRDRILNIGGRLRACRTPGAKFYPPRPLVWGDVEKPAR